MMKHTKYAVACMALASVAVAVAVLASPDAGAGGQHATSPADLPATGLHPSTAPAAAPPTVRIGTSIPDYSLQYLAENVPYAIKGNVTGIVKVPPQTDSLGVTEILTDVVINVHEDLFDKYTEKTITVRIQGGEADGALVVVDGSPEFTLGEDVFVLVAERSPGSIYGNSYYVAGEQYGKYSLDANGNAINKDPLKNISYESLKDAVERAGK